MAIFYHLGRPIAHLDLANVRFFKQNETQSGLADTTANGLREFAFEQHFMERQVGAFVVAGFGEL